VVWGSYPRGFPEFSEVRMMFEIEAPISLSPLIWAVVSIMCLIYAACFASFFGVALVNYFRRVRVATV